MKQVIKATIFLLLTTFFFACKKDRSGPKPTRMWYWDTCKILSFKNDGMHYLVNYNDQGYPDKVSAQHPNFNVVYKVKYDNDQLIEVERFYNGKSMQKMIYSYSGDRITSIGLFGSLGDSSTVELNRAEFKYESSPKPTSYILFSYDMNRTRKLLPFLEANHIYDTNGNVSKVDLKAYYQGEPTNSKQTVEGYYDNNVTTGKFLNLLFFSFNEGSPMVLFSDHNWYRSNRADSYSPPFEQQINLEYDENGNVKNSYLRFADIKWKCE